MKKISIISLVYILSLLLILSSIPIVSAASSSALPVYVKASAVGESVIALKSDGTVWTWGRNDAGQIGDGSQGINDFRSSPSIVIGVSDVVDVASGGGFNVVLKKDGSVWAWGIWGRATEKGEYSLKPVKVEGFSDIISVAAGDGTIIALKRDGTVWMLETNPLYNDYYSDDYDEGETPSIDTRESQMESKTPYQVKNLTKIKSINTFGNYTDGAYAAVKEDGTVWTWGGADYEQIVKDEQQNTLTYEPLDDEEDFYTPTQVKDISNVVMVAPADEHMLALKKDGTVWTWGIGMDVKVGAGNIATGKIKYIAPTPIPELTNIVYIASMPDEMIMNSAIAVKKDGTVWRKHLYSGSKYAKVASLTGIKAVAAGTDFLLFTKTDGTIWSCGNNEYGQLGNGYNSITFKPEKLSTISNVTAISTGANNSIALKKDGTIWHWGTFTQILGSGANYKANQVQYTKPTLIQGLNGVTQVSAGNNMVTLVKSDGTAWALGNNFIGELGNGTKTFSTKPVKVSTLTGVKKTYNIKRSVSDYTVALMNDGTLRSWGDNQRGQLGDGTKKAKTSPVAIKGINNVISVALDGSFAIALKSDGTVWGWGSNIDGTLGNSVIKESLVPIKVNNLTDIAEIATCGGAVAALKKDGTVWTWGYNGIGQLGVNSDEVQYSLDPVKIPLENIKAVAVGDGYMLALKDDGTVWTWGSSGFEDIDELGYDKMHLIRQVPELNSITAIVAGSTHSIALRSDGSVWVWGLNKSGQLGNGAADMFYPVKVVR